jgi:predicted metal-dependent phosphoesterase TrpH
MLLKGCIHIHTTCSDGELSPQEVADAYSDLGYDFIAFTDHDSLLRPNCGELYDGVKSDMILFQGIELTVFEKGYLHITRIRGERETLHILNHLGDYDLSLEQLLDRIRAVARRYPLDAVEITSKGFPHREYEIPEIPYPKIASDDAHGRIGIGRAWIEMDCRREGDAILRAIKKGRFWNCYRRG